MARHEETERETYIPLNHKYGSWQVETMRWKRRIRYQKYRLNSCNNSAERRRTQANGEHSSAVLIIFPSRIFPSRLAFARVQNPDFRELKER